MKQLGVADVGFENQFFWKSFFRAEWQNAWDESGDRSVGELLDGNCPGLDECYEWWKEFTQYSDDVFEASDGYLDNPTTLRAELDRGRVLRIEFHPGDTLYFLDGQEIGCTGPHPVKTGVPYRDVENLLRLEQGEPLFFLLLPMAWINETDVAAIQAAKIRIERLLHRIFDQKICADLAICMVCELIRGGKVY